MAKQSKFTGGEFIIKSTDPKSIFTPEEWTEEQLMIKQMTLDWVSQEIHPRILEIDSQKDPELVPKLMENAAQLGMCGFAIEEKYGGMDLDFNTGLLFSEAIATAFSFATSIGAQTSIGSLPIVYYGNDEQKQKYLPKIATAEYKAAYALTEPEAGSDANSGKTKASLSTDGKTYTLNGQKMWITNGGFADIFIVFAKIEENGAVDKNLSAFIVEKAFGGVTLGEEEKKMGIKGSSTVQVFFNDCVVPAENLLGKREDGFKIALNILNSGRIKLAIASVGASKLGITRSINYANERKQFEKSISEFGAIKHKIGEMTTRVFVSESASYRVGYLIDQKEKELLENGFDKDKIKLESLKEYAIECAIMKVHGSEVAAYVADEAVQIFGGMGFSQESLVEGGYRNARILRIFEGTNEINRMLSVGELMKRALKEKKIDIVSAGKGIPLYILGQLFKGSYYPGQEATIIENIKKIFLVIVGGAGKKLKLKLIDEQEVIINLADILTEAYVCESVWLRIQKLKQSKSEDATKLKAKEKMMQLYFYEALQRVKKSGEDAIRSYATGNEQRIMLWILKKLIRSYTINPKNLRREIADTVIKEDQYCF